jgi:hypothetical protein
VVLTTQHEKLVPADPFILSAEKLDSPREAYLDE